MRLISVVPLLAVILFTGFGIYIFTAFLFLNTRTILKRESRSLSHILTLFLAVLLLVLVVVPRSVEPTNFTQFALYLGYSVYGLIIFYLLHLTQFVVSLVLCNFSRPKKNQDYIIVLGCWAGREDIPPLLARRVERAAAFYREQNHRHRPPKLVLSGGQGSDEICSEAEAMRAYAIKLGIPDEHLLMESKSTSTPENMQFSKEVMDRDFSKKRPYRCIYATTNYHVLRAGLFAKKAGLNIAGIGSKTAFYYLPNAVLREYIAYVHIHLKRNIVFVLLSLIVGSTLIPLAINRILERFAASMP